MKILKIISFTLLLSACATQNFPSLNLASTNKVDQFEGEFLDSEDVSLALQASSLSEPDDLAQDVILSQDRLSHQQLLRYFDGILNQLLSSWPGHRPEIDLSIELSRSYSAYATRQQIVLSMGMISDCETEAEIAFVIAHELSHILLGHNNTNAYFKRQHETVEEMAQLANLGMAIGDLEVSRDQQQIKVESKNSQHTQNTYKDIFKTSLAINRLSRDVINSSMSREYEDEADLLAIDLLVRAGYNPRAYDVALQRLESSQTFTQQQLLQKKQEYQKVVTILSESKIPQDDSLSQRLIYYAGNEAATQALQIFAQRHRSAQLRSADLSKYIQRQYKASSIKLRPLHQQRYQAQVKSGTDVQITRNYWHASNAIQAMQQGDLVSAEKSARKAVSKPTSSDGYPRIVFSQIRLQQGQLNKAVKNLDLIKDWKNLSLESSLYAVKTYQLAERYRQAEKILRQTQAQLTEQSILYPQWVSLYYQENDIEALNQWLDKCRAVGRKDLSLRCNTAAKIPVVIPEQATPTESLLERINTLF
ncbi:MULTISPECIES: M48 family metalloprotease [unclassified Agarivorans]|uniref:M48 family metalloprotease n=1 Tax=unclassified Agarivorans TaxID=2636026 RepID=UPI003D7DFA0C